MDWRGERRNPRYRRVDREFEGEKANFEIGGAVAHAVTEGSFYD